MAQPAEHPQPLEGVVLHQPDAEPIRALCPCCLAPVIRATLRDGRQIVASLFEWTPLGECASCRQTRNAHPGRNVRCSKCNSTGLFGERRPGGDMLAIDIAWADDLHIRVIGPNTDRRRGEALYPVHICGADY